MAPWTAACQASLSITNSRSLLKLMCIKLVMPYNHLILCHPLLLPPSFFARVFSNESILHIRWPKFWRFSLSISPLKEYSGLISFRINWFDLFAVSCSQESSLTPQFKNINSSTISFLFFFLIYLFFEFIYSFLKNNCFTEFFCFLSNLNMNQP